MTLLSVRQQFISLSGRYDLISDTDTYEDNGADKFINAGQNMLDRMANFRFSKKKVFKSIDVGGWYVVFGRARAIKKVWVSDDEEKYELTKKSLDWIKENYADNPEDIDQGGPLYYAPAIHLLGEGSSSEVMNIDSFGGTSFEADGSPFINNALVLMPPSDENLEVEIQGLFYSTQLTDGEDMSVWTEMFEMVLVWAALYMLEISYRNTNGANDWLTAINREIVSIDKDGVEEEIADVNQIED